MRSCAGNALISVTYLCALVGVSTGGLTSKNCNVLIDESMFKRFLPQVFRVFARII